MIEGSLFPTIESNLKGKDSVPSPFPASSICSALKPAWSAKIISNHQRISSLIRKITQDVCKANSNSLSPADGKINEIESLRVTTKRPLQQQNLLNALSNLTANPFSLQETASEHREAYSQSTNEKQLIQWLNDKGYSALAEKLDSQNGYPWDDIKTIHSPILIEQLMDIYALCCHKNSVNSLSTEKFMDFALNLAKTATTSTIKHYYSYSSELIDNTKQILGQLLYLINKDPELALKTLDNPYYNQILENLNYEFNLAIQEICYHLQSHYIAHYETQLQSPDVAVHTLIPIEIAKFLLTDIGTINVGIIEILSDIFLSSDEHHFDYEVNLSYALKLLQRSPKLRASFEKIHRPHSLKMPSNEVICTSLGLPPETAIDDFHARLTALIALLSHLRQGEDGSCFAISLAIEVLSAHLNFCLKDLSQILHESKLTRHVKNVRKDIPFVKRISDENINKLIHFDHSGCLIIQGHSQGKLWKAPGIQAACTSIGLIEHEKALLAIIGKLPFIADQPQEMSIKCLLEKLCEYSSSLSEKQSQLSQLFSKACFAFSSQTSQPLLKVWENVIAGMAEAEEGSMIKTTIFNSTMDALQFRLGELHIPPSRFLQRFFLNIQKILYESIHLQYDPAISGKWGQLAHAKLGGFVLYKDNKRVDNSASFREFILDILLVVTTKLKNLNLSINEKDELNKVINILVPYIDSAEFMGYLLAKYHPSNTLAVTQLSYGLIPNYEKLTFTPWITQTGNDSKAVLKVYLEAEQPLKIKKFIVQEAEETLLNIIEMCKQMPEEEKKLFVENPHKLKPFCIRGKHRLPFMAGHSSLAKAWHQESPTKEWMDQYVLIPGQEIAQTPLDSLTKKNLYEQLQLKIIPLFLSNEQMNHCLALIKQISEPLTIKQYREAILEILKEIPSFSTSYRDRIVRALDTALCQSLEPQLKKKLEDSAVHFADTNWYEGIHDLHFCFAINPGTGQLELWEAYSNGSHLMALDQNYWLFNQKWEFLQGYFTIFLLTFICFNFL